MRSSRWIVTGAFAIGAVAGLAAGCQVYDFEPVRPIIVTQTSIEQTVVAKSLKPNLMLLVDKSASMDLPSDPSDPDCGSCGANKSSLCPSTCPTRWTELQGAMSDFLTTNGDVARMGLAIFPNASTGFGQCGQYGTPVAWDKTANVLAGIAQSSDVAADLQAQASLINSDIQGISSPANTDRNLMTYGGTPTAHSLEELGARSDMLDPQRQNFVLLLTDGLPNCNNSYSPDPATCTCTSSPSPPCPLDLLCLDDTGSITAIQQNLAKNIKTIVVGFGAETGSGTGATALNSMAAAGGFPRKCTADGGCAAGDTCGADNTCTNIKYYQATNRAELAAALAAISSVINKTPCDYQLSADPQNGESRFLVVYITETGKDPVKLVEGSDTYEYVPGWVHLLGSTCNLVSNATPDSPVKIEIRLISSL